MFYCVKHFSYQLSAISIQRSVASSYLRVELPPPPERPPPPPPLCEPPPPDERPPPLNPPPPLYPPERELPPLYPPDEREDELPERLLPLYELDELDREGDDEREVVAELRDDDELPWRVAVRLLLDCELRLDATPLEREVVADVREVVAAGRVVVTLVVRDVAEPAAERCAGCEPREAVERLVAAAWRVDEAVERRTAVLPNVLSTRELLARPDAAPPTRVADTLP